MHKKNDKICKIKLKITAQVCDYAQKIIFDLCL